MKRPDFRTGLFLVVDAALLLACLMHIPYLVNRQRTPFELEEKQGRIIIGGITDSAASGEVKEGDELLSWEQHRTLTPELIGFLTDLSSVGERIPVTYRRSGTSYTASVQLVDHYRPRYPFFIYFVGIVSWSVGVFVLLKRRRELAASTLHWALIALGVSVMMAKGEISPDSVWTYVSRTLFFVSYAAVPTALFFFTTLFPRPILGSASVKAWLVFVPMVVLVTTIVYFHLHALKLVDYYTSYQILIDIFYVLLFVYVGAAILNFVYSYLTAGSLEERQKLKWILWGLCVGPTPFLLLSTFPQMYLKRDIVPEEFTIVFLLVIPFAFAISFVKYRLLDIEVVINRTTVYAIVLGGLTILYTLSVVTLAAIIGTTTERLELPVSVAAAIVVALLFEPARRWTQGIVDRTFFRVRYNFREAQRRFVEEIRHSLDVVQLAELIVVRTDELLAVERIGFFALKEPGHRLRLLAHRNYDILQRHSARFEVEKLKTRLQLPVALDESIEPGVVYESAHAETFLRWGMALVFPMMSERSEILGFLVLGRKKSGVRFTAEDVDLLNIVTTQTGLAMERITLQVEVMLEHAETQRLQELNRLKSYFVSSVSHDLKTPLTSIRMFAELLQSNKKTSQRKTREYLQIIEGESERLTRLINNVLDFAKVERGVKEYSFSEARVNEMVLAALRLLGYQLKMQKFAVRVRLSRKDHVIRADPDAVVDALINVLSNAMKYSTERKHITVSTIIRDRFATVRVEDRGIGVSRDGLKHIFDPFYRAKDEKSRGVGGVGLGLSLVRHVMEAHGGKVEVNSKLGKGSAFTLSFPLKEGERRSRRA